MFMLLSRSIKIVPSRLGINSPGSQASRQFPVRGHSTRSELWLPATGVPIQNFGRLPLPSTVRPLHDHGTNKKDPFIHSLFSSNETWAQTVLKHDPNFFSQSAKAQTPKLLWIGCSDSRLPESVIMATKPGEIFVTRNVANQFHPHDDSVLSVLAYAVNYLGVEQIAIVGHSRCGGAIACYNAVYHPADPTAAPIIEGGPIGRWLGKVTDLARRLNIAKEKPDEGVSILIEENVKMQVGHIVKAETIQNAWKTGKKIWVHGWVYDIEKGLVRDLGVSVGPVEESHVAHCDLYHA